MDGESPRRAALMRFPTGWRPARYTAPSQHLLEVVTPRTNAALLSPAENLFGALSLYAGTAETGPLALEISADRERRRFLVRTGTADQQRDLVAQIGAAYPQAMLRPLGVASQSSADPARPDPDEQVIGCTLELRTDPYLPVRTFGDRDLDADAGPAQTDPVLGILAALGDLPDGWRAMTQLVLFGPAPGSWAQAYQRLALESPVQAERAGGGERVSFTGPLLLLGGLGLYLAGSSIYAAWQRGDWLGAGGTVVGLFGLAGLIVVLHRFFGRRTLYDPRLVQDKLSRDACRAELRLAVFARATADPEAVRVRLGRIAAAYRPFTLAAGNGFVPRPLREPVPDLRVLTPFGRTSSLLNVRELAGLWHLPQAADDVALVERTTARRRLPLPATVGPGPAGAGCRIGASEHQGQVVPVHIAPPLLRRHLLAVAKTRRGKSSLLLTLVHQLLIAGAERRCVVLVDPHRDLAAAALGLVPPERQQDVVYLDIANRSRAFGINLLDVGLGWDRDQAVGNALRIFRREWDAFWGPRMEDAFRFALMALFEANEAYCRDDSRRGPDHQHTILEVPALLAVRGFRARVLKQTRDRTIGQWFDDYFDPLDPRLRLEIINPVQTKVHKYLGSVVARQIVGQPRSTVDFRQLIAERKIVLINLSAFDVGEDTAALVGGTLVNLAARAVAAHVALPPEQRQAVTIAVDEFHTIPGADYEQVFGELSKYGANMILATQTLARLDRLTDAQRTRDLRAAVFSNLDGLFAFHTSAEDAAYLVDELGGGLDAQDLLELGHYQCYARLTDARTGERLPSFSVQLDPPPRGDETLARHLAEASARRYGRDAVDVDLDLQAARARIDGPRRSWAEATAREGYPAPPTRGPGDNGLPAADRTVTGSEVPTPNPPRAKRPRTRSSARPKSRQKRAAPEPPIGGDDTAMDDGGQGDQEL